MNSIKVGIFVLLNLWPTGVTHEKVLRLLLKTFQGKTEVKFFSPRELKQLLSDTNASEIPK